MNHYTLFVRILHTWKIADIRWQIYLKKKTHIERVSSIFEQNKFAIMKAKVPYILETCQ